MFVAHLAQTGREVVEMIEECRRPSGEGSCAWMDRTEAVAQGFQHRQKQTKEETTIATR